MICKKCNVEMKRSIALENTWVTSVPDFGGVPRGTPIEQVSEEELYGQTIHPGDSGKMILCFKCPECGRSVK